MTEDKDSNLKERDFTNCGICTKPIFHDGLPYFYRVRISQFIADTRAIERRVGLERMMNGNTAIAQAFSPDEDLAVCMDTKDQLICATCALSEHLPVAVLMGD